MILCVQASLVFMAALESQVRVETEIIIVNATAHDVCAHRHVLRCGGQFFSHSMLRTYPLLSPSLSDLLTNRRHTRSSGHAW